MTPPPVTVSAGLIERTAKAALVRSGALAENARPVARAIARAEVEGNRVCGLFYLPIFCEHLRCGKIDGRAEPEVASSDAVTTVDAGHGFAHRRSRRDFPISPRPRTIWAWRRWLSETPTTAWLLAIM